MLFRRLIACFVCLDCRLFASHSVTFRPHRRRALAPALIRRERLGCSSSLSLPPRPRPPSSSLVLPAHTLTLPRPPHSAVVLARLPDSARRHILHSSSQCNCCRRPAPPPATSIASSSSSSYKAWRPGTYSIRRCLLAFYGRPPFSPTPRSRLFGFSCFHLPPSAAHPVRFQSR